MFRHKNIDRVCCVILALTLLASTLFVGAAATGVITEKRAVGYETRLFDQSRVQTIDIVIDDWEAFLTTCASEEYAVCQLVIDGEHVSNAAIRGKGNTSLTSVASYGNNRYSFKVEFDHYQSGSTYHGLDKLSLNNLIQDNTYMKDYFAYTLMNQMGVASPLCSFVKINVNGEYWGLYLAVEGVEDAFLRRNYGKNYGELYKPDSLSFGGGRGNGRDFDMGDFDFSFGDSQEETSGFSMPGMPSFSEGFDPSQMPGSFSNFPGMSSGSEAPADANAPAGFDPSQMPGGFGSFPGMTSGSEAPADASAPVGFDPSQMPGGFSNFPGMPSGSEAPTGASAPAGFDPSQMPGGFGNFPGMSSGSVVPAAESVEKQADATASATMPKMGGDFDPSQMMNGDFEMPSMDFGGFGGFGSSTDVKLQYTDDDPANYSNIFTNAKTDITKADQARLIASLKALNEGDTSVVDTEAVIRYMAVHNFLCNDDSYTGMMVHNYYLYEEDGVLSMIPWDYNLAYGGFTASSNGTSTVNTSIDRLVSMGSDSDRPMAGWITSNEDYMAQYRTIYQQFMDTLFANGWFETEIDRVTAMIAPYVESDPTAFCTYEEFETAAQTLKAFCLKRSESVTRQLNGDSTRVDASELDLSSMGSMSGMGGGFGMPGGDFGGRSKGGENRPSRFSEGGMPAMPGGDFAAFSGLPAENASSEAAESVPSRQRPSFDGPFGSGMMPQQNTTENVILLAVCLLVLLAGCILAKCYQANR